MTLQLGITSATWIILRKNFNSPFPNSKLPSPNCILSSSDDEDDHATERLMLLSATIRDDQISERADTFEIKNEIADDRLVAQRLFEEFNPNMTIADLSSTNAVTNVQSSGKYILKSKYI